MQLDSRPPWPPFHKSLFEGIALGTTDASEPADVRELAIGVALDTLPANIHALKLAILGLESNTAVGAILEKTLASRRLSSDTSDSSGEDSEERKADHFGNDFRCLVFVLVVVVG